MVKRYISSILIFTIMSSFLVFAPSVSAQNNAYVSENFNSYITGDIPHTALEARAIGNGTVSVCDKPSQIDKSVFVSNGDSGSTAFI